MTLKRPSLLRRSFALREFSMPGKHIGKKAGKKSGKGGKK
jgi:hypothetical protein